MKKLIFIMLSILITLALPAQKLTGSAGKNPVGVGEPFQLTYSLDAAGSGFKGPSLNDFDVYSGPSVSQSFQNINGNTSQSMSFSYYLAAKKEGKFTIGPASITLNGKKIESNSISLEVVKGTSNTQNQQQRGNQNNNKAQGAQPGQTSSENLFVKTTVNKTKAYIGEQVIVTHKVYTRLNLVGFQDAKIPSYTGFWAQDPPKQTQYTVTQENIDGIKYSVVEFKKSFLFPQRSGTLEIDPIEIDCIVRQQAARHQQSIWDIWGPTYEDVAYKIKGRSIKMEIVPLPEEGKPKDFSGAVGSFTFKAQLNKDKVKTNDAINLNVTINGKGNIKLIEPLKINIPQDIESYDPKLTENIGANAAGVSGTKSYEYVLIPRHPGNYKIDQVNFSYFDPEKKTYVTLPSPEFNITVEKGEGDAGATVMAPINNRKDVAMIGNDIRYIKTNNIQLTKKGTYFFGSALFYAGLAAPGLIFFLFLVIRRKHIENNSNTALVKSRKATKMAHKRLEQANKYLQSNNKEPFYEEIFRALYGYLGDKLSMQVADLSKESIASTLAERQVSEEVIQQLISTIDSCEYARYAPSAVSGDLKAIYDQSVDLITKLENEIKAPSIKAKV